MTEYRSTLPERPKRIMRLPLDVRGFPIPWFVSMNENNEPDFFNVSPAKIAAAHNGGLCWICGDVLGVYRVFVIGPLSTISRVSSEPSAHLDCAEYAAKACPFLANPNRTYISAAKRPPGVHPPEGSTGRNPGLTILWVCKRYQVSQTPKGAFFRFPEDPENLHFYKAGKKATYDEVRKAFDESVEFILPTVRQEDIPSQATFERNRVLAWKIIEKFIKPGLAKVNGS